VRTLIAAILTAAVVALVPATSQAAGRVSPSFFGVVADGPMLDGSVDLDTQFNRMVGTGVGTTRVAFSWTEGQPGNNCFDAQVISNPEWACEQGAGGKMVATNYTHFDQIVTAAATHRISLLPVIEYAPGWAAKHPGKLSSPPKNPADYAAFVKVLVDRYGPNGTFWSKHPDIPKVPIRSWQIWNEPSFNIWWSTQPFASSYVKLLKAAHDAIKGEDPGAKVVLAGIADSSRKGNLSWQAIEKIYKAGGRKYFDVVADHPFTLKVNGVRTILEKIRKVMAKYHDRSKQLWVTELCWTSAKGKTSVHYGNDQTQSGQAKNLAAAYRMLAKYRSKLHIGRVYWFTWLSRDQSSDYPFDYAGLNRLRAGKVTYKPAATSYRKTAFALQKCKVKKDRADRCTK
jgi:hypothetical protein